MGEIILNVTLEGTGAGLENGRLGLSYFNLAFKELLSAYRGIATMFISSADSDEVNIRAQGRRPRLAEQMDLEIDSISHHSPPAIQLVCTIPDVQTNSTSEMFSKDIVRRTAFELIDAIDSEARGNPRNKYVRRFLQNLPPGTRSQSWRLFVDGGLVKTVEVARLHLPTLETASPGFVRVNGRVSGIHFPPSGEIRLTDNNGQFWFKASNEQIENAITLRSDEVTAVGVQRGGRLTLLWIRNQQTAHVSQSETRDLHFAKKWSGVLKRLAK